MHRILYIDDEPGLLEIAKRFLEKTNDFSVDIDTSAEHALQSIGTMSFHAIISDYQMPGMDGIAFLKAVRSRHGNIPFILFTGRGREEVVIEAINNGVDFYIQKGGDPKAQFAELAHKIRQAISRRQAELSVIESEKRLSDIINFLPDATFAIDRSGRVIAWNRAIEEMTGVVAGDILGKGEYEYAIPFYGKRRPILIDLIFEPEEEIRKNYQGIIREKDVLIAETDLPLPKGMHRVLMGKASPLYNQQNEIIGAIESIRDITQKKETENALQEQNQVLAAMNQVSLEFTLLPAGENLGKFVVRKLMELTGAVAAWYSEYHPADRTLTISHLESGHETLEKAVKTLGKDPREIKTFVNEEMYKEIARGAVKKLQTLSDVSFGQIPPAMSFAIQKVLGIDHFFGLAYVIEGELYATSIIAIGKGKPDPSAGLLESFSHMVAVSLRRRYAEEKLLAGEEKFRTVADFTYGWEYWEAPDHRINYMSPSCERISGYSREEFLQVSNLQDSIVDPLDREIWEDHRKQVDETDQALSIDFRILRKDGEVRWINHTCHPVFDSGGRHLGRRASNRDITDKKRTDDELRAAYEQLSASQEELQAQFEALIQGEKQVRESEEKFRTFMEASIDGVMLIDADGKILAWNPAAERIFGIPAAEATASNILELQIRLVVPEHQNPEYIEELRSRFSTSFPALFSRDTPLFLEVDVMNAQGRRMIVQQALFPIETSHGKHVGCIVREVTEQRNAEKNLRESEVKFRELAELLPQIVFEMDLGLRVTYANRYALSAIGLGEEDIAKGISGLSYIDPADYDRVRENTGRITRGEPVENREYTAVRKDGTTFPVLIYTSLLYRAGKIEGFRGVIIDITDRKKAENALRESERFLTETQKIARLGGWKANPHTDYLEWTEGIYDIIEAPRNYRPGLNEGLKYYSPEDIPVIREKVITCLTTGEPFTMEARIITETGKKVWTEVRGLVPVIEGAHSYVIGTLQDITEQKIARDELWDREVTLASILRAAPVGIGLVSNRVLLRVNERLCEMTGYLAEELVGKSARVLYPSDEEFEWVGREKYIQIQKFGTGTVETRWQRKDGAIRDILLSSTPLDPEDQVKGVTFTALDITDRKRVEHDLRVAYEQAAATEEELRGQFEELAATQVELHKRQQQLEEITGTIPEVAYQFFARPDGSMGLYFVSDRSEEVLGISNDTADFFERFTARVDPRDREAFLSSVYEAVRSGSPWNFEGRFIKPSGDSIWFQGMSQPFTRGMEIVFSGTLLDITGRKLAEESLQKSEEKYRTLVETTGTGFVIIDDLGRVLDANPEYVRLTGHARLDEIVGKNVTDWTAPYEKDKNAAAVRQCLQDGFIRNLEIDYVNSSGTITPIEINATLFQAGEAVQVLTLCRDISKRRGTQVALQEGEAKYRTVVEQSHDGIFIAQDGLLIFHNPMFATMTGYRDDELVGRPIADLIAPEDRELVMTRHQERLHGKALPEVYEFSVLHHDGTSRIRVRMNITFATVGGKPATIGTLHNVVEERKREEALRESEERFRRLISSSFEAVVIHQGGRIVLANDVAVRIIGAESTGELIGRPILDLVHPEFRAAIEERVSQILQSPGGAVPLIEEKFVRFNGTSVDVEVMATATMHEGKPAVMVMFRDITGRKQADDALRTSESRLRLITENMADLITRIDKDRRVVYTSPSVERLTGYSPADINGHPVTEFLHPDDRERLIQKIRAAIEQQLSSVRLEYRYREKSGKYLWFESETRILHDINGKYCGAVFSSRDITERKRIEGQLLEKTEELDRYFTTSLDLFCIANTDGFFLRLNPEWEKTLGYSLEELEGHRFLDFVHPDDMSATLAAIADLANQNEIMNFSNRYRHKDGSYRWIEWRSVPRGNRIYAAARDMTGRRNMENAIREANRKLNLLNSVTRHDVANQLMVLQGYTEIAAMQNPDPAIADLLSRIDESSRAINRLIEFTRTYQELGIDTPGWCRLDQIVAKAGKAEVMLSDTCKNMDVFADPMLERVFSNLFDNVVRHGERVTLVTLRCQQDKDDLVIRVEDNGVGIPANEKEKIFMRGYGKNTGFGLFLAREILAITGITIRETGVPGEGARFELRVPKGMYRSTGNNRDPPVV